MDKMEMTKEMKALVETIREQIQSAQTCTDPDHNHDHYYNPIHMNPCRPYENPINAYLNWCSKCEKTWITRNW